MQFVFEDQRYELSFSRKHKRVNVIDKMSHYVGGTIRKFEMSKHPYTTATIRSVIEGEKAEKWPIIAEAEVGCLPGVDKFSPEDGRVWALRKLMAYIPPEMKPIVWSVYHSRVKKLSLREKNKLLRKELADVKKELDKIKGQYNGMVMKLATGEM